MWVHNVTCYLSVKQLVKANACPLLVEALRRNTPRAEVSEPIVHRAQWSIPHGVFGCVSNAQNGKCAEPSLSRHPHHHCRLNSILKLRTLQLLSTASLSLSLSSGCSEAAVALARAFLVHAVDNEIRMQWFAKAM